MKPLENGVEVALATQADDTLVQAFARLLPQLSQSAPPLSKSDLDDIIRAPCNHVFIATMGPDRRIVGTLTLVHFRIPTGVRAWIEDVVVDAQARGLGAVFLDARREAIPFYEREHYAFHPAPSMKKQLGG